MLSMHVHVHFGYFGIEIDMILQHRPEEPKTLIGRPARCIVAEHFDGLLFRTSLACEMSFTASLSTEMKPEAQIRNYNAGFGYGYIPSEVRPLILDMHNNGIIIKSPSFGGDHSRTMAA